MPCEERRIEHMFESTLPSEGSDDADGVRGEAAWCVPAGDQSGGRPLSTADVMRVFSAIDAAKMCPPGEVLDHLEKLPPDDVVMAVLRALDGDRLTPAERVRVLRLWDRCGSWASAQQQQWLVAVAGPTRTDDDPRAQTGKSAVRAARIP